MGARRDHAARAAIPHARAQRRDVEPDRLEHEQQQAVLLEAVAAAARLHELSLERRRRQLDGAAGQDVEVLERNRLDVRLHDAVQRRKRRLDRTVVADAGEIGGEIHVIS